MSSLAMAQLPTVIVLQQWQRDTLMFYVNKYQAKLDSSSIGPITIYPVPIPNSLYFLSADLFTKNQWQFIKQKAYNKLGTVTVRKLTQAEWDYIHPAIGQ